MDRVTSALVTSIFLENMMQKHSLLPKAKFDSPNTKKISKATPSLFCQKLNKMVTIFTFFQLFFSKTDCCGRTFCFLPHLELPLPASSVWPGGAWSSSSSSSSTCPASCDCMVAFGLRKSEASPVQAQPPEC